MSQAYLAVGVKLDQLLKTQEKKEQVTRYDEKTGRPYVKEVVTETAFFGNRPMTDRDDVEGLAHKSGLEVVRGGYDERLASQTVVGTTVYTVADCNSSGGLVELVDPEVLASATRRAEDRLKAIGCELPVRMYLVMREAF